MQPPFHVTFETGTIATGIHLTDFSEIPAALQNLGLTTPCPTLVIVGGASGLSSEGMENLRSLFHEVICPFVTTFNLAVIDGGTDAGVMRLMGQARSQTGGEFNLIGIIVKAKAILPDDLTPPEDAATLEPHHTHFLLVPGQEWGDESSWIAEVADVLAGEKPSLTLLINGGAIALRQDVPNSLDHDRPVLIVGGSGRTADRLANAVTGKTRDLEIQALIDSGLLYTVDLTLEKNVLRATLEQTFKAVHSV